jgi:hypothetical protein
MLSGKDPTVWYGLVMALVVAFVGLSLVGDESAPFVGVSFVADSEPPIVTGTITQWRAGESIAVATQQTDPQGFEVALRPHTVYEGETHIIKTGARVSVWYRNVGERRRVAERVRVLTDATR